MERGYPLDKRPRLAASVDRGFKPQTIATAMMRFDLPVRQIVAVLRESEPDGEVTERHCNNEYKKISRLDTVYGKVSHELPIELEDWTIHKLYVNNPFALVFAAASLSKPFSRFLQKHLKQTNKIVFYCDETTPGNALRPDNGRSYEALLWTFGEFPIWYRTRRHGWFKFCYVLADVRDKVTWGNARNHQKNDVPFLSKTRPVRVQL